MPSKGLRHVPCVDKSAPSLLADSNNSKWHNATFPSTDRRFLWYCVTGHFKTGHAEVA
jgi:hypothetical protein